MSGEGKLGRYNHKVVQLGDKNAIGKIRALEEKIGAVVVALEAMPQFAHLSEDQIALLQSLERELSLVLVAYDSYSVSLLSSDWREKHL
jgi:hypothetical protein